MTQLLYGLNYMHRCNLIHRDLSHSNVLIKYTKSSVSIKIIDYGFIGTCFNDHFTNQGTTFFKPPEIDRREQWEERSDVFSLG